MAEVKTLAEVIAMAGQSTDGHDHFTDLLRQCENFLPSGSGFDDGTSIVSASWDKIVLQTSYHHMSEHGVYTEWTGHKIIVTPSFMPEHVNIAIGGRNVNDIKNYIDQTVYVSLCQKVVLTFHANPHRHFTLEYA